MQKETDAGIVVSGAKVVATSAAITHYNFMGQSSKTATEDLDMSLMFMVPIDAPGLKLICRTSLRKAAALLNGSPFDYPLSSRFDENDAIFILDNVFVPWEDVFIYRDPARVLNFYPRLRLHRTARCSRAAPAYAVKLDFLSGLAGESAALHRWRRGARQPGVARRGDRLAQPVLVTLKRHGEQSATRGRATPCCPNLQAGQAYRVFAPDAYPRIKDIVQNASSPQR